MAKSRAKRVTESDAKPEAAIEHEASGPGGPKVAICLPGGGITGAMYQIGALAALEHAVEGLQADRFSLYFGSSSGASVAAALAGGVPVQRLYRAFLDPVDTYFPLERNHILRMDSGEWRRVLTTVWRALRHGSSSFFTRGPAPSAAKLWQELDRLYDSLPAGVFSLDNYERFLADFFVRRGIPNHFGRMPRPLRVVAHDLDSGKRVLFGSEGHDRVPITRACAASMAIPPFFSPVRVGDRHYFDAGPVQAQMVEDAAEEKPDIVLVINPMVPVDVDQVPTGHGVQRSVRDKGYMWVANQAIRIGMKAMLDETVARVRASHPDLEVLVIEPASSDAMLFMHNPASFAARREILEDAYKTTRERTARWLAARDDTARVGWRLLARGEGSRSSS
jgi:NTE family protein